MSSAFIKSKHLVTRAGFGIGLSQIKICEQQHPKEIWKDYTRSRVFKPILFDTPELNFDYASTAKLNADQKKLIQQRNRKQNIEVNLNFLQEMVHGEDQLREKMAFFLAWAFCYPGSEPQNECPDIKCDSAKCAG